jgi:hypothetical protein
VRFFGRGWLATGCGWWPPGPGWIARRYVEAAEAAALDRAGGVDQLDDALTGAAVTVVRPHRPHGYGQVWEVLCANHDQINQWVDKGLTVVKIGDLLGRQGTASGGACADLHRGVFPAHVRVVDVLPNLDRGDRRLRSGLGFLPRCLQCPHSR